MRVNCCDTYCLFVVAKCTGVERASWTKELARVSFVLSFFKGTKVMCLSTTPWSCNSTVTGLSGRCLNACEERSEILSYSCRRCWSFLNNASCCSELCKIHCLQVWELITEATMWSQGLYLGAYRSCVNWVLVVPRRQWLFANFWQRSHCHYWQWSIEFMWNVYSLQIFTLETTLKEQNSIQWWWLCIFSTGGVADVSACPGWLVPNSFCLTHSVWLREFLPESLSFSAQWGSVVISDEKKC